VPRVVIHEVVAGTHEHDALAIRRDARIGRPLQIEDLLQAETFGLRRGMGRAGCIRDEGDQQRRAESGEIAASREHR
jgi:hypothetical protein